VAHPDAAGEGQKARPLPCPTAVSAASPPRVTVGVPTYNRAGSLARAVESVLAQTHADLELVISDNASTDATPATCAAFAERDERVRVLRQPRNLGLTENFNRLLREAAGEMVMVLGDDDWLEPTYVEDCLAALDADPGLVLASGGARHHGDGPAPAAGAEVDLLDDDPELRVRRYFAQVRDNVTIYGLVRRDALQQVLPMQNRLAGDWLLCGRLAMLGRIRAVGSTWVNCSVSGTSSSYARMVRSMGLSPREARHPHLTIASFVYADIARDAAVYEPLGLARRRRLGLECALALLRARPLNVVEDALAPLLRRPRLRWIDRLLRPVAQRLQR
jgi:glycosyltransferase involved in cell wall biosynthesis